VANEPPDPNASALFPTRLKLVGDVDPDRVADALGHKLELQLRRAFEATAGHGAPRLGTLEFRWTGVPPTDEVRAATQDAVMKVLVDKVRVTRSATPVKPAPPAPLPRHPKKRTPPIISWHPFKQVGDEEFQYAFAHALGQRWETAARVPQAYAVMFRLVGVAEIQLWFVIGNKYVVRWGLVRPGFAKGQQDRPDAIGASEGEYAVDLMPDGHDKYMELAINTAEHQIAGLTPGKREAVPDVDIALKKHEREARALVTDYLTRHSLSVFYKLTLPARKYRIIPTHQVTADALGNRTHFDVLCLVDAVTQEESDDLDDENSAEGQGSLLVKVPDVGGGTAEVEGSGNADAGGGSSSDVTAEPGEGRRGGRGIVIAPDAKEGGSIFMSAPRVPGAERFVLTCEPYDGELSSEELGAGGERMRRLIDEIAARLDMPPCRYPAHFCMTAYSMIMVRRTQVAQRLQRKETGFFEPLLVSERDVNGAYSFKPVPSVAIQFLQHLAATVPRLRRLEFLILEHSAPRMAYAGWFLHFVEKLSELAVQACGDIYYSACQICLHQLLNASLVAVEDRISRGGTYVAMFEALVHSQLATQVELVLLSDALASFLRIAGDQHGDAALGYYRRTLQLQQAFDQDPASRASRRTRLVFQSGDDRELAILLADETNYVFRRAQKQEQQVEGAGQIVETEDNVWAIRGSDGKLHTRHDLELAIQLRRQVVASIDPIISQITHNFVSEIRPIVDGERTAKSFVDELLGNMRSKNLEVTDSNLANIKYALEHGQIHRVSHDQKDPPALRLPTVPGGRFILSGIHAMAHELVGKKFANDQYYDYVLDHLLGHELAWREFRDHLVFVGTIVLSVICPPLGAAVGVIAGIVTGIADYRHAKQTEAIYEALINPEDVLNYAEIQVEILSAKLSIGLSFLAAIPEVGSAIKGVSAAGKRLAKEGLEVGTRSIARHILEQQLEKVGELCAEKFAIGMARELATASVMSDVMEAVISPFIEQQIAELEQELADESGEHAELDKPAADSGNELDDDFDDFDGLGDDDSGDSGGDEP
jgi:hypothetical protein